MASEDDALFASGPAAAAHRLHPLSLLFHFGRALKVVVLPMLFVLLARPSDEPWWATLFVVPGLLHSLMHYLSFRYRFEGDELVVQGGIVFRFERHIPYARIQNIDLAQGPVHRLLRVADVRIETGGGGRAEEAHMQVLSLDAVDGMRRRVAAGRCGAVSVRPPARPSEDGLPGSSERDAVARTWDAANVGAEDASIAGASTDAPGPRDAPDDVPVGDVVLRLGPRDLLLFGLISNRGTAVVLAALGLVDRLGLVPERLDEAQVRRLDEFDGDGLRLWLVLGAIALLVLWRVLSVAWAFVNLDGFELRLVDDELQTRCGLLTRHTASIPRERIQVVTVTETLLHRLVRRAAVKVDTAGGSVLESKVATRRWVAPLVRRSQLARLVETLVPGAEFDDVAWLSPDPRARRRFLRGWIPLAIAAGLLLAWSLGAESAARTPVGRWETLAAVALAVALLTWGSVDATLRARRIGCAVGRRCFQVRHGLWTRTTRLVRHAKAQSVTVERSPLDRFWRMAGVSVDAAGTERPVSMRYLAPEDAERVQARLLSCVCATDFRW